MPTLEEMKSVFGGTSYADKMYNSKDRKGLNNDAKLRAENPGLQELWEQYQTMLKLCKPARELAEETDADDLLAIIRNRRK